MTRVPSAAAVHRAAAVLIIDDERANVVLLERILERAGYNNVRSTTDSSEGLAVLAEWRPDLLLLDLMMPSPDGFEILAALGAAARVERTPVLVLTASAMPEVKERALAEGASDFVTKPFDHTEVLLRIRNLLATRALEQALREHSELLELRVAQRTDALTHSLLELERSMDERQQLMRSLVTAQEEERRRIATDIHDDTIQVMIAASLHLERVRRGAVDTSLHRELDELLDSVREAIARLRTLLFDVHPAALDRDGLGAALRAYLERMHATGGPRYELDARLPAEPSAEIRATLYRIAQEAITNARKHARATSVTVTVRMTTDGIVMRVEDDGVGFDVLTAERRDDGHLGLTSMRERAAVAEGVLDVHSEPGRGTTVEVRLPDRNVTAWDDRASRPLVADAEESRVA